jgi:hypothetical protein
MDANARHYLPISRINDPAYFPRRWQRRMFVNPSAFLSTDQQTSRKRTRGPNRAEPLGADVPLSITGVSRRPCPNDRRVQVIGVSALTIGPVSKLDLFGAA